MAEPETKPESEAEPDVEPELDPEPEVEPEIETGAKALTEPEPEWTEAFNLWGPAWHIHVYMVASFFMLIALLAITSMCFYLKNRRALKQGILTFTLQCLLLYFTLFRSLAMFINPYQTVDNINSTVFAMVWSCALPGLTASFSVLLLVFLDTTKMTLGPPVFQQLSVLLIFTMCHFIIVVSSDRICLFSKTMCKPMLLFCQILFILYGTLLAAGYCYTAVCLHRKCVIGVINDAENSKLKRLIRISGFAAAIAFCVAITHLYAACSEFGIYSDVIYVNAWDWWILQTVLRLEEIASSFLILLVAFRCPLSENSRLRKGISKSFQMKINPTQQTILSQGPQQLNDQNTKFSGQRTS